jgi:hypothetical protein
MPIAAVELVGDDDDVDVRSDAPASCLPIAPAGFGGGDAWKPQSLPDALAHVTDPGSTRGADVGTILGFIGGVAMRVSYR